MESSTEDGGSPLTYLHGGRQIVPGVEQAIEGAESGEVIEVEVAAADAFGERDPRGVFLVPRSAFPDEEIKTGDVYSAALPDGRTLLFRVVQAGGEAVLVDANHPLSGEELHVWVAVRGVREATTDELQAGRVTHEPPAAIPPS